MCSNIFRFHPDEFDLSERCDFDEFVLVGTASEHNQNDIDSSMKQT